jgi:hypothetical protein
MRIMNEEEEAMFADKVTATLGDSEAPGFKPRPICGRKLTTDDLHFIDCEGGLLTDLERLKDYADVGCEGNVISLLGEDWDDHMTSEDRDECVAQFRQLLEDVAFISMDCPCGFSFCRDSG